ncbi:MAG: hypothetical protein ACFE96_08250 [Candidatus Hermodarchaeota archaeon]
MSKVFGILSFVFGILGICVGWILWIILKDWGGFLLPSFAIIFGIIGIIKDDSKGLGIAGLILGIIGLIIEIIIFLFFIPFIYSLFPFPYLS